MSFISSWLLLSWTVTTKGLEIEDSHCLGGQGIASRFDSHCTVSAWVGCLKKSGQYWGGVLFGWFGGGYFCFWEAGYQSVWNGPCVKEASDTLSSSALWWCCWRFWKLVEEKLCLCWFCVGRLKVSGCMCMCDCHAFPCHQILSVNDIPQGWIGYFYAGL